MQSIKFPVPSMLRALIIPLVLLALTGVYLGHVVFAGDNEVLPGKDLQEIHYPLLKFVVDAAHETGELPLWNPSQFMGYSVVGNSQNGLFYPPNWLLLIKPDALRRAMSLLLVAHVFWAAWGMATLARLFGADRWSALLAGAIFGFGCPVATRLYAGHYALLLALAWIPWIMAGYRVAVQRGPGVWTIPGGIALAMAILAGHPQMVYLAGLGVAIQWLYELITADNHRLRAVATGQLALIGLIGLMLSAISWLPMYDYMEHTTRGLDDQSLDFANQEAIQPEELAVWVTPYLFSEPLDGMPGYWQDWRLYEEVLSYAGLIPLLLLFYPVRYRQAWFFAALAGIGVLFSLGIDGGLYLTQYRWFPLVRGFRAPGRALLLTSIGLGGLVALAISHLRTQPLAARQESLAFITRRVVPVGLVMLWGGAVALSAAEYAASGDAADRLATFAQQLALAGVFWALAGLAIWTWTTGESAEAVQWATVLTIVIALIDVWHVTWPLTDTDPVQISPVWSSAQTVVPPDGNYYRVMQTTPPQGIANGASWVGLHTVQGYDPVVPADWFTLMGLSNWAPNTPISRLAGVRYVLSGSPLEPSEATEDFVEIDAPSGYVYENPAALPRAYFAARYEYEPYLDLTLQRIELGHVDSGELVLLASDPVCPVAGNDGTVTITRYEPNQVEIATEQDEPGILVLTDLYDEDWRVSVDGQSADMLRANFALRAVCVPEGAHTIHFEYRPRAYLVGRTISGIGWFALIVGVIGWAIWRWRGKRRSDVLPTD